MEPMTMRSAGLLVPLFSIPSTRSWGIGEIADLAPFAVWLREAGLGFMQVLPLNEMAASGQSPYSAMSAMAIDPIYISVGRVEDFRALGGAPAMGPAWQDRLASAVSARRLDYRLVREVKMAALAAAFGRFKAADLARSTPRAARFKAWSAGESWWLDDYAVFRALHAREKERSWIDWPEPLRARTPDALLAVRRELADEILFRQYLQWIAGEQWQAVRRVIDEIEVFGDLPFMVDADSADVWARQDQFRLDASVGAPPDAFSKTGQRWGLPPCRWDVMSRTEFQWLAQRARRSAALFDGYRVDHLVGFYRTYVIPDGEQFGRFEPENPDAGLALGEEIVKVFCAAPARVIAEDLGTVPDWVRTSLTRLGVAGYRVLRWEREWHTDGRPFRDPADYPALSVATTGTHDTETLAVWWDGLASAERAALLKVSSLAGPAAAAGITAESPFAQPVRDLLLEQLYASGSDLLILPVQDVFGWRDRVNLPGLVSDDNWTWRLPWLSDEMLDEPDARERAATLRLWGERHGRRKTAHEITDL
jgi:4-alpha-glucanotransferase